MKTPTKPTDTILIYENDRFKGSRAESIDFLTEHLDLIDPECYRVSPIVTASENGDVYEVHIYVGDYLGKEVAV